MNYPGNTVPQDPDDLELTAKKILLGLNSGAWTGGGGGTGAGVERAAGSVHATGNGSVAAGSKSVSIASSSDFVGTVQGATFGVNKVAVWAADGADTVGAIAYTVSAGSLDIATLT